MLQPPSGPLAPPARRPAAAPPLVPSVSRALALLDRLAARREPMSLAQLTSEVNLYKALGGGWNEQTAKNEPLKEQAPPLKLF